MKRYHTSIVKILFVIGIIIYNNNIFAKELPIIEKDGISIITKSIYHSWIWYARFKKWFCTDYAASRRPDIFPSKNGKDRPFWGSAIDRYKQAKEIWILVWNTPQVWAIAVFKKWQWSTSIDGHVAIVEKILDNNMIEITDMNYLWKNIITTRIIPWTKPIGYIYSRKDIQTQMKYVPHTLLKERTIGSEWLYIVSLNQIKEDWSFDIKWLNNNIIPHIHKEIDLSNKDLTTYWFKTYGIHQYKHDIREWKDTKNNLYKNSTIRTKILLSTLINHNQKKPDPPPLSTYS